MPIGFGLSVHATVGWEPALGVNYHIKLGRNSNFVQNFLRLGVIEKLRLYASQLV